MVRTIKLRRTSSAEHVVRIGLKKRKDSTRKTKTEIEGREDIIKNYLSETRWSVMD
jgi:hypothetical protein